MNKLTTLKILIGLLVVLNIGLLAYLTFQNENRKSPPHFKEGPPSRNMFGFDEAQMKLFEESKEAHFKIIHPAQRELHDKSMEYYMLPSGKLEERQQLQDEILALSQAIYEANLKHFDDVRAICKPEQLPEMEYFIRGLLRGKPKRGPKHMRGGPGH